MSEAYVLQRRMSISAAEFLRQLERALDGLCWRRTAPGEAKVEVTGGHLVLHWQPAPPRRLGRLSLPVLELTLTFPPACPEAARNTFLQRFDLAFQRGGG